MIFDRAQIQLILSPRSHVIYVLEVKLCSGLKWYLKERFSDLRQLHKDLKALHPDVKKIHFPARSFLRHKAQTAVVEDRRVAFEKYFQALVSLLLVLMSSSGLTLC